MRKAILSIAIVFFVSCAVVAQVPTPDSRQEGYTIRNNPVTGGTPDCPTPFGFTLNPRDTVNGHSPLAPATALLLGLAAGVAGIKIYRNNQSNQKKGDTK